MARKRQQAEEQRWSAIERHVGRTPEQRLRWAVEVFLRADLMTEIPEALAAYGVYLKAFMPQPSKPGEMVSANLGPSEGLPAEQVKRLQAQFREGLMALRRQGEWPDVPTPTRRAFAASASGRIWERLDYEAPETAILAGLAEHVRGAWSRLRNCPECHRLFVRNRKQQYCSARCSMARRNRTRTRPRSRRATA